jgi:MFS family permease
MTAGATARVWTATFLFLCVAAMLASANQGLLTPSIPLYVHALGGSAAVIGLMLAGFSVTSVGVRPFVGYWTDSWSLRGVFMVGTFVLGLSGFVYLIPIVPVVGVITFVRGFAWAAFNTAAYTLLAHLAPAARRAEATGYFTVFSGVGHAVAPVLAVWLIAQPWAGFSVVFLLSSAVGIAATLFGRGIRWSPDAAAPRAEQPSDASRPSGLAVLFDRGVLLAAVLLGCVTLTQPAASNFVPLLALERGIAHVEWYYFASAVTGVLMNVVAGRLSDRAGLGITLATGFAACIAGLLLVLIAQDDLVLAAGGALYGVGQAYVTVGSMALAIERADPQRRGAAMATYSAAYSTGQGIGALFSGVAADVAGYGAIYVGAVATVGAGLAVTALNWPGLRRATTPLASSPGGAAP